MMKNTIVLFFLFCSSIHTVLCGMYDYRLIDPDRFTPVTSSLADFQNCYVCRLEQEQLKKICKEVADYSINYYNFYVKYLKEGSVTLAAISRSFGYQNDTKPGVVCPSKPTVYLFDGIPPSNQIFFMITDYRGGDKSKIFGLSLLAWKEYLNKAKEQFRPGGERLTHGSSSRGGLHYNKEKFKKHLKKFIEFKKRRKERKKKKQQGWAAEEQEQEEEEESGIMSEEFFQNFGTEVSEAAEGGFFSGMLSDFMDKIGNIEMPFSSDDFGIGDI